MKVLLAVALLVLVGGCSSEMSYEEKQELWMLAAQDAARAQLKDSGSAEFSGLFLEHFGGNPVLCGWVNARNGFGGYSGARRFIYRDGAPLLVDEGDASERFAKPWWQYCGRRE